MTSKLIKQSLFTASAITIAAGILSRPFGYLREAVIASHFGTGSQLETFLLAITLPELLAAMLYAALPTAIIPALQNSTTWPGGREKRLFLRGLFGFGLALALVAGIIFIGRVELLKLLAPDLNAETAALGHRMIAILAGVVLFRGLEAYFRGWLHNGKHFIGPALSPFLLNAVLLGAIVLLYNNLNIEALAYGWLVGTALLAFYNGFLALKILIPAQKPGSAPAELTALFSLVAVVAIIEFISLAYPAVDRAIASRFLGDGQIAALRYSFYLVQMPPGLLVVAFSLASYPWISDLSASTDNVRLTQLYNRSIGTIVYTMLPVVAGMLWFAPEIVRVAFQRGAFDNQSVELTTEAFICFSTGLVFYSVYIYQMRYYYARKMMVRVGVILLIMLVVKLITSALLAGSYGHRGLALATAFTWVLGMALMTVDLRRVAGLRLSGAFWLSVLKAVLAVIITGGIWYLLAAVWSPRAVASLWVQAWHLGSQFMIGLAGYFLVSLLLKQNEPRRLLELVQTRFKTGRQPL